MRYLRRSVNPIVELCAGFETTDDRVIFLRGVGRLVDLSSLYVFTEYYVKSNVTLHSH